MMRAALDGKNVWKAGGLSLLSSAASYGIGCGFNEVGTWGHEMLRAGAHGLASGIISALGGGNFLHSFISGAAASGIGSYAQSVNIGSSLMVASTTLMGGVVAWAMGDDFLHGAMRGMTIGIFNHVMHDDIDEKPTKCEVLPDGTLVAPFELEGVTIFSSRKFSFKPDCLIEKPLESVYPEFGIILLGKTFIEGTFQGIFSMLKSETGGWKQWVRTGISYSREGGFDTKSIRWGASRHYAEKIKNPTMRNINQNLRNTKIPINNWRTVDKGHFHWKWGDKDTDEWFWIRK